MTCRGLAYGLVLALAGCGDDSQGDSSADGSSADAGSSETGASSSGSTTSVGTVSTSGSGDTSASTGTTGESLCGMGESGNSTGSDEPWLEINHPFDEPLETGSTLALSCGFQGSFMFPVWPYFDGFVPELEFVELDVVMDVEGFNNNPEGHFASGTDPVYVGCEEVEDDTRRVAILLPDEILDPTVLDGLPAELHFVLHAGELGTVDYDASVQLSAVEDQTWEICNLGP